MVWLSCGVAALVLLSPATAEIINGTEGNDVIRTAAAGGSQGGLPNATHNGDMIYSVAGDDLIEAGDGPDAIVAGPGADVVRGAGGDDTIVVRDGDEAAVETVDGGPGLDSLQVLGGGYFDLTQWSITAVEVLQVQVAQVALTATQLAGLQRIEGSGSSLFLAGPGMYRLDGKLAPTQLPFSEIYGTAGDETLLLDHSGGARVLFDGRDGRDVAIPPGSASDYTRTTNGASVFLSGLSGQLNFEFLNVETILFRSDPPVAAPDTLRATIGREGSFDASVLLANDIGVLIEVVQPSPQSSVPTAEGGTLVALESTPVASLAYRPPSERTTPFSDVATYRLRDSAGQEADGVVNFTVDNRAPEAPDRSYTLLPGAAITVEDLLAQGSDPDGNRLLFQTLTPAESAPEGDSGTAEPVLDSASGQIVGYRVYPGTNQTTGSFSYRLQDDSAAIGNTDTGIITVQFIANQPGQARPDNARATIDGNDSIPLNLLTANDDPGVQVTGLVGMVPAPWDPGLNFVLTTNAFLSYRSGGDSIGFLSNPGAAPVTSFQYTARDALGNARTATVTMQVNNRIPGAVARTFAVASGGSLTVPLADLVRSPGNTDPDGDPLVFADVGPVEPGQGTIAILGPADPSDPDDFGSLVFTPAPGFTGTVATTYSINDRPDLQGVVRGTPFASAPLSFVVSPPPPPAVTFASAEVGSVFERTDGQPSRLEFVVQRNGDLSATTRVTFQVQGGPDPAASADDIAEVLDGFTHLGSGFGSFSFAFGPGEATRALRLGATPDAIPEPDETVQLVLTSVTDGVLPSTGPLVATGVIRDDDARDIVLTYQVSWTPPYTLTFPTWPTGFLLEGTDGLASAPWVPVATNPPVTVPLEGPVGFFRLRQGP